ncbi:MAG: DNA polymerase II large subunit, partial [Candidatus Nanoarchaeia archaeon]
MSEKYFKQLVESVKKEYDIAEKARQKLIDPVNKVEIPLAMSLAEKSVGLISSIYPQIKDKKIVNRILELEKEYGQLDVAVSFQIAEEIAKEKFCKFSSLLEAIDAGIRVGFAYNTLGVVASPIEGYTGLKLGKTKEGKDYFIAYFSGPIRSAGTTATCVVLLLIDYLRELFGFAKYDPSEQEIKRYITENYDYHERVTNLQYLPTEEEIELLAKNLPIQIAGEPTEQKEVSNYKDLPRVDTNFIRGGMCLAFSEGLAQKAAKGYRQLKSAKEKGFKSTGWDFLEDYIELHKKRESGSKSAGATYINDLVAGRPVYGHPGKQGGFRFRYGRSRVCGFSAVSIHPATMIITNGFLSSGTQLKIEKPTKGCVVTACDSIDGPIVKFKDGSVKQLQDEEEARQVKDKVEEILFLGDMLFPLGDVINRNSDLLKSGYVEEWWEKQLERKLAVTGEELVVVDVSLEQAITLSKKYSLPLHPRYIFYWNQINDEQFNSLLDWLALGRLEEEKLILPYEKSKQESLKVGKRALELIGAEHDVVMDNVVVKKGKALLVNIGDFEHIKGDVLEAVNKKSEFEIRDKTGVFIGSRMGRPEKAKLRKLTGSPNGLFPIGEQGGRLRSVREAVEKGYVKADFPIYRCECGDTIYKVCEKCGKPTKKVYYCPVCNKEGRCEEHESKAYRERRIDVKHYFEDAINKLGLDRHEVPEMIKGVRGTSSKEHDFEHLGKGILRARHNLNVNKDGTIRYDATELPVTHFKPKEVGTSIEKLKELGYLKDIYGKTLQEEEQILELMPHDVILPACLDTKQERADEVFMRIANFIDEELERLYKLPAYYNLNKKEDLVGHLVACMAPHNCAGVIGRIIGFAKLQGLLASPYMHAAMRRDCFDFNTYLPIKQNGEWRLKKIGELVEDLNPIKEVDNFGTKEKQVQGFETIGFDNRFKEVGINNFTKHAKRRMYEIRTATGRRIRVTENHKFLINGKKKRTSDLKIGDEISLPYKINISEKRLKQINLLDVFKDEDIMVRGIKEVIDGLGEKEKQKILTTLEMSKKQFYNYHNLSAFYNPSP